MEAYHFWILENPIFISQFVQLSTVMQYYPSAISMVTHTPSPRPGKPLCYEQQHCDIKQQLYGLFHVSFGGYLVAGLYRKFLQLDNSSFCYYERPAPIPDQHKATTVLLLHGFTVNKTMWMVVSKFLPKDWRIVVLDLPGHGESSFTSDGNYSAFGLARKLHDVSPPPHTHTDTHCAWPAWVANQN